jgi:hypothetical protein
MLSVAFSYCYTECHFVILNINVLNVVMLSVIMLSAVILNVVMVPRNALAYHTKVYNGPTKFY